MNESAQQTRMTGWGGCVLRCFVAVCLAAVLLLVAAGVALYQNYEAVDAFLRKSTQAAGAAIGLAWEVRNEFACESVNVNMGSTNLDVELVNPTGLSDSSGEAFSRTVASFIAENYTHFDIPAPS